MISEEKKHKIEIFHCDVNCFECKAYISFFESFENLTKFIKEMFPSDKFDIISSCDDVRLDIYINKKLIFSLEGNAKYFEYNEGLRYKNSVIKLIKLILDNSIY